MSMPSTYKPSPLSFGSPRTSPFRRPESPSSPFHRPTSPSSPSTTIRATTPTPSPKKPQQQIPPASPSKLHQTASTSTSDTTPTTFPTARQSAPNQSSLTSLPPAQVREMRESFQILDRDNDGLVTRDDVTDMLSSLGQPSTPRDLSAYFPPSTPHPLPLPHYLSTLSTLLGPLSSQTELLNAFAAFDDHDTGEVDMAELRDAIMNTAPEGGVRGMGLREVEEVVGGFTGRREFGREMRGGGGLRGEVFRYREWVGGIMGAGEGKDGGE